MDKYFYFDDIFQDYTKYSLKISKNLYLKSGLYPIIDQGKEEIAGYSDKNINIFDKIPVIIFGDHTRIFKYVDYPFFSGADGVKILKNTSSLFLDKYLYYSLKNFKIPNTGYNRHFKWLKDFKIKYISLAKQEKIVSLIEKIKYFILKKKEQLKYLKKLNKSLFTRMFGGILSNSFNWEQVKLQDICSSIVRGPFGSSLKKEFFVKNGYKVYEQKNAINQSADLGEYYIDEKKFKELQRFECKTGDIIMSCSGTVGKLFQLPKNSKKGIINQALCKFSLNNKIISIYFLKYLEKVMENLKLNGSGIKNISSVSYIKKNRYKSSTNRITK